MGKSDFLVWEMTSRDTIDFKKIYVDLVGDLIAGLLLSQIVYWHLPNSQGESKLRVEKDGLFWLVKSREDWWKETRITTRQYDRAIKILDNLGIVTTKLYKFNGVPTIHLHLNWDVFLTRMNALLEQAVASTANEIRVESMESRQNPASPLGFTQSVKSILPKGENAFSPKVEMHFDLSAKTVTESTTKILVPDISPRAHAQGQGNPPNRQNGTSNPQVTILNREEQKAALGQAVSGSHALAFVTQAQAEVAVTAETTPVPADSPQPERTPEEKAFSEITTLYIDNKFKPSVNFEVQDRLAQLVEEYGATWVMGALQVALKYNSHSLGYVETVLDGWREKGIAPWEKPKPTREAQRGGRVRQRGETASRGTVHVQPGKYDEMNERLARLVRRE